MALSFRAGNIRPFVGMRDYDDDSASTLQVGFTSYGKTEDGQDTYQTSYLEWGGRSDHLVDGLSTLMGVEPDTRLVSRASESERRYVASDERNGITAAALKTVDAVAEAA